MPSARVSICGPFFRCASPVAALASPLVHVFHQHADKALSPAGLNHMHQALQHLTGGILSPAPP